MNNIYEIDDCCERFLLSIFFFLFFFFKGADVEARDYSGRKPKHYIKETMSLWLQSKFMD